MSLALNNVTTTAEFPGDMGSPSGIPAAILESGPCAIAEVDVFNHAAYVQLLVSDTGEKGQAVWQKELYLSPQHRQFIRRTIFGIRFRSAVAGEAAQVTVELIGESETYLAYLEAQGNLKTAGPVRVPPEAAPQVASTGGVPHGLRPGY